MNKKIDIPPSQTTQSTQSDSLDWIRSKLLSFLNENHIQAQDTIEVLNQILNQIGSSKLPQEHENRIENETEQSFEFLKRIDAIKGNLKDIIAIQDYRTKRAEFDKLMRKKPSLQKAIDIQELMRNSHSDFDNQERKTLQEMIQASEIWSNKVQEFLEKYEEFLTDDEFRIESSQISEITKGINQLKEEMNLLILKDEGLESKILIFEWRFQAKLFMSSGTQGLPKSDLKYWKELLAKAQEGKHKEVLESERHREICKEVVTCGRLIEQVKEIEDQEKLLLELGNNREDIETIRLRDRESIESLLQELPESKVLTLKEERFLQRILDKAEKVMTEYQNLKNFVEIPRKKFRSIVKELQKLPIKLPQEIEEQILKEERINELLKEVIAKPSFEVAQKISREYENCYLDIPKAQEISRAHIQAQEVLQTIKDVWKHRRSLNYKEICELENQVENSPLDFGAQRLGRAKVKIWLAQVDFIKTLEDNVGMIPDKPLPLQEVDKLFKKRESYLRKIQDDGQRMLGPWANSITFLQDLINAIDAFFAQISDSQDPRKESSPYSRFIDMEEKIAELKAAAVQRKVFEQSSLLGKRREPSALIEPAATSLVMESEEENSKSSSQYKILMEKVKTEDGCVGNEHYCVQDGRISAIPEEEKVSSVAREEAIERMLKLVDNLEGEVLKNPREVIKELENKIVIECRWRKRGYNEKVEAVCDLLTKLEGFNFLRGKLFKQKLEYGEIEKCLKSNIGDLGQKAYRESKKPFQNQVQPKEEHIIEEMHSLWIPPQQLINSTKSEFDHKGKDAEKITEQFVREIKNNQDRELLFQDPFKYFKNHPLDPPQWNLSSSDFTFYGFRKNHFMFDPINFQNYHPEPPIHHFNNQNRNRVEIDGLKDGEITPLVKANGKQIKPFQKENLKFEVSNTNEKNPLNPLIRFGEYDKTIKQIFKGRISQQTPKWSYELQGSLYTEATSDYISQFPNISIPELKFERVSSKQFLVNLQSLQNHDETSYFRKALIGWVSVETTNQNHFVFKRKNKKNPVGKCSVIPGVEIYLLPVKSDTSFKKLKLDLNWTHHENKSPFIPERYLLFAMCLTKPENSSIKRPTFMTNSRSNKKSLEEKKASEHSKLQEESEEKKKKKIWAIIRPEKTKIKTREKSQRQKKAPALFEPEGKKMNKTGKGNKFQD